MADDLHFGGSLHDLVVLREANLDVRIVRAVDSDLGLDRMADAMDDRTALVAVSLVSNVEHLPAA